jgi:hypothetical protein
MLSFVCAERPLSSRSRRKEPYQRRLRQAFKDQNSVVAHSDTALYGAVYYFYVESRGLDADNLSKPIWDALKGVAYDDDKRVRLRHAGVVDLRESGYKSLDLSGVGDEVAERLIVAIGTEPDVLYVEIGELESRMFEFGRANRVRLSNESA